MSFRDWFENVSASYDLESLGQAQRRGRLRKRGPGPGFQTAEILVLEDRTLLSAPTFVQPLGAAEQIQPGSTSLNLTTTAAVGAGHSVILELAMMPAAGAVSAYAHAPGSPAHLLDFHVDADVTTALKTKGAVRTVLFSSHGTPALAAGTVITFTFPASNAQAASAAEFRGLSAANTLDVTAAANGKAAAVTSGTSRTTAAAQELLIGAVGVLGKPDGAGAADAAHNLGFTAGSGYSTWAGAGTTTGKTGRNVSIHPEYELTSAVGVYQASGTLSKAALGKSTTLLAGYRADLADHFSVSAPASAVSGQSFVVTVTARDVIGNVDAGYTGTVHWTSSDANAGISLPADVTFAPADHGVRQFTLTLLSDGSRNVTVTDKENVPPISGSAALQVVPAAFSVSLPAGATAGDKLGFTVTARRFDGSIDTSYSGTVHFSSSDRGAGSGVPADYTFTAADKGVHTFASGLTLVTAGKQSVVATDASNAAVTGNGTINVSPVAATHFGVSAPATSVAGSPFSITVTARDQFGNVATGYKGTMHFTKNDPDLTSFVPADYTFTASDNGTHTFTNLVTLVTIGSQSVTATDTGNASVTGSAAVSVTPAAATRFDVTIPPTTVAGSAFGVTVTARDRFNNVATGYTGTIHFTKTDSGTGSALPADYTFVAGDAGVHTFKNLVTFVTAGSQSLTATDTVNRSLVGNSGTTKVSAAAATQLVLSAPATATAGSGFDVTLTTRDQFGNVATGYTGAVHFTKSDTGTGSSLPADYAFVAGDGGVHAFSSSVAFVTVGNQSMTATDKSNSALTTSSTVSVTPATATHFSVSAPAIAIAGSAFSITVTARDQFNNVATGYTGTVKFSSSDLVIPGQLTVPANYTFIAADQGSHTFTNQTSLATAGNQSLTASDISNASLKGTSASVSVSAAAATSLSVTGPGSATAGSAFSITVTAQDQFGNVATGYAGIIHFTTIDYPGSNQYSSLPLDYTFGTADAGTHTFSNGASLNLISHYPSHTWSVAAIDRANGSITGSTAVLITPGPPARLGATLGESGGAGVADDFYISVADQFGNIATSYVGTVHFSISDHGSGANVSADYTFTAADQGFRLFTKLATFVTAGPQTLAVADSIDTTITPFTYLMTVPAAAATHFDVATPATTTAGNAFSITVTARDQFNNVATGYTGTIHFSKSDFGPGSALPANYTFFASDNGVHTFTNGVTLTTAGNQTVTATDTASASVTGSSRSVIVTPAATDHFGLSAPTTVIAGNLATVYATALDRFGNVATGYTGDVIFTSNEPFWSGVHVDGTFNAGDAGVLKIALFWPCETAGVWTITVTDYVTGTLTGSSTVSVQPAAATDFVVNVAGSFRAGVPETLIVAAYDAYGNVATGYRGTVSFRITSGTGQAPADYTFTDSDQGVHVFSTLFFSDPGQKTLFVIDNDSGVSGAETFVISPLF